MRYPEYGKKLKGFAGDLRNQSTKGEVLLWQKLRARTMMGYQFNRQRPLGKYIVDFFCQPLNLVIEIDVQYHNEESAHISDLERQSILEVMGINFIRFSEQEVGHDMMNVLRIIEQYIISYEERFPEVKAKAVRKKHS